MAHQAMVATSHPLATSTALKCLYDGGNAVDAAIAAAAVLTLAEPHMTSLGGDAFALVAPKGDARIHGVNGSGRTPAAFDVADLDGADEIPRDSPHAVTIPGAVDAWALLHEKWGRADWQGLFAAAIDYAKHGILVHERVGWDWGEECGNLGDADAQRHYLKDGKAYKEGQNFACAAMGAAFERIAIEGRDGFYKGAVAEDIVGKLNALGGRHSMADFARPHAEEVAPINAQYRGKTIWQCPPNGQGLTALIMARIFERFNPAHLNEADRIHLLAEISKQAYGLRDLFLADPAHLTVAVDWLLSDAVIDAAAGRIDMARAGGFAPSDFPHHPDTIYLAVVDADGMAVSFIQSIFDAFGSGIASPQFGILLQSRGRGFRLNPKHPNAIAANKRPLHTIIPAMLTQDDKLLGVYGVMGGQYQAVGQMAFLINYLDLAMSPQGALDAPRSFAIDGALQLESTISAAIAPEIANDLNARGHQIIRNPAPIGGGQAILRDSTTGALIGASDMRKDGFAAGY